MAIPAPLLTGLKFERWTVGEKTNKEGKARYVCTCDCGTVREVNACALKNGDSKSCGCFRDDRIRETNTKHGACGGGLKKRGDLRHPLYIIWCNMKQRCHDKNHKHYKDYGGRGIFVCKEWQAYKPFRDYMLSLTNCPENIETPGSKTKWSIDRFPNNDGSYEPGNVRWAEGLEQNSNRRNVLFISVNGTKLPFPEAVRLYGKASLETIRKRIHKGWSLRDAFLKPSRKS